MAELSEAVLNAIEQSARYKIDHKQGEEQAVIYLDAWVARHLIAELRDLRTKVTDLTEVLCDVTNQACAMGDGKTLHSMALSANAVAMRTLAEMGKLEITKEHGKMVEGKWKE